MRLAKQSFIHAVLKGTMTTLDATKLTMFIRSTRLKFDTALSVMMQIVHNIPSLEDLIVSTDQFNLATIRGDIFDQARYVTDQMRPRPDQKSYHFP